MKDKQTTLEMVVSKDFSAVVFPKETLQELRKAQGFTQQELADQAGISREILSCYERGIHLPGAFALSALAGALSISEGTLYQMLTKGKNNHE